MLLITGYLAAIVSMLGWGSYFVPMKRVKTYDPVYYHAVMCVSIFISSTIITAATGAFLFSWFGFLSGVLWASGNILSVFAVKHSKLAIAAPVWMSVGIFGSFLWGILFFKEPISAIFLAILGLILLVIGIIFIASTAQEKGETSSKGVVFAFIAGLLFGAYLVPFKLSGLTPLSFLFPMSIGALVGGFIPFIIARPKIDKKLLIPGGISGIVWNTANISSFFAVGILGIAIGFPLTQMALFVSVLWGLLYFHEIKGKSNIQKLILSAVLLFAGAIILSFSK